MAEFPKACESLVSSVLNPVTEALHPLLSCQCPQQILTKSKESIPLAFPERKDSDATPMLSDSVDSDVEGIPSPSEPLVLGQDREEAYAGI